VERLEEPEGATPLSNFFESEAVKLMNIATPPPPAAAAAFFDNFFAFVGVTAAEDCFLVGEREGDLVTTSMKPAVAEEGVAGRQREGETSAGGEVGIGSGPGVKSSVVGSRDLIAVVIESTEEPRRRSAELMRIEPGS